MMTPTEFAIAMANIAKASSTAEGDPECAHEEADKLMARILRGLGYAEGVEHFLSMTRWYA